LINRAISRSYQTENPLRVNDCIAMKLHTDCRYFQGSRPCTPHKQHGASCAACAFYAPVSRRILIIKLDSMGDVLRTTSVLPALRETYPACFITWITRREAVELVANNPYIDELLIFEAGALNQLLVREFDLVLGLDMSRDSGALCALAKAPDQRGFSMDTAGVLYPLNSDAGEWYYMGLDDGLKKKNTKSYQQILLEICGLPPESLHPPQYYVTADESRAGRDIVVSLGLNPAQPIIGINTGSGSRWKMKSLPFDRLQNLIEKLAAAHQVLLLGGPEEVEKNAQLSRITGVPDSGCGHSLRQFAGILSQCRLVITGDTLALHLALAQRKLVIAVFGPTSAHEIDLFQRGEKFSSAAECLCCYLPGCDRSPTCMELISTDDIARAAERLLSAP
jgi:ADP-heptose:LPS heptosyltransferase